MNSNALIHFDSSTSQRRGALIRGGPGYIVGLGLDQGGKLIDLVANFGYVGPDRRQHQIQDFFSKAEKREQALDELYRTRDNLNLKAEHEE